jgi:hypothetical protein
MLTTCAEKERMNDESTGWAVRQAVSHGTERQLNGWLAGLPAGWVGAEWVTVELGGVGRWKRIEHVQHSGSTQSATLHLSRCTQHEHNEQIFMLPVNMVGPCLGRGSPSPLELHITGATIVPPIVPTHAVTTHMNSQYFNISIFRLISECHFNVEIQFNYY